MDDVHCDVALMALVEGGIDATQGVEELMVHDADPGGGDKRSAPWILGGRNWWGMPKILWKYSSREGQKIEYDLLHVAGQVIAE